MAPRIFLALIAVFGMMWFLSWYKKAERAKRNRALMSILLYGVAAALLILVITGRIPWLFALFSAAMPWLNRVLMVKQMWNRFNPNASGYDQAQSHNRTADSISEADALEILGLEKGASQEEIIARHKKLMQKIHPDKGGSGYLASHINQAKDTLLKGHG